MMHFALWNLSPAVLKLFGGKSIFSSPVKMKMNLKKFSMSSLPPNKNRMKKKRNLFLFLFPPQSTLDIWFVFVSVVFFVSEAYRMYEKNVFTFMKIFIMTARRS